MMPARFSHFIGIDWSGAAGPRQKGIAIAVRAADGGDVVHREEHARLVVRKHHGDDGRVVAERGLQLAQVQRAVRLDRQPRHLHALLLELLAMLERGGMLDARGHDVPLAGLRRQRAVEGGVRRLRAAACEDDLPCLRADQRRDRPARLLKGIMRRPAETVRAGGVAPLLAQERLHRREHLRGDPGGGVVVEIAEAFGGHGGGPRTGERGVLRAAEKPGKRRAAMWPRRPGLGIQHARQALRADPGQPSLPLPAVVAQAVGGLFAFIRAVFPLPARLLGRGGAVTRCWPNLLGPGEASCASRTAA